MACTPVNGTVPKLLSGMPNIQNILSKIPQFKLGGAKDWKSMRILRAVLWLSNPANMALVKSLLDIRNLGDLTKLTALTNILKYAGMDGFIDASKLSGKLSQLTDALDCVSQNLESIQSLQNSIIQQVQEALSISQIYSALGVSQVLSDLGIVDSYLFSQINAEVTKKLGVPMISSLPVVSGVIPMPSSYTQFQRATYAANSLTQTFYMLNLTAKSQEATSVLYSASRVASLLPLETAGIDGAGILAVGPNILERVSSGASVIEALESANYTGVPTTPYPGGPIQLPENFSVEVPTGDGTETSQISPAAQESLKSMGSLNLGALQDGLLKQADLLTDQKESIAWRKRILSLQLSKYEKEFVEVKSELSEIQSILTFVPKNYQEKTELNALLDDVQKKNGKIYERWRVLDYKIKAIRFELSELGKLSTDTEETQKRLNTWSESLSSLGATQIHPYTSTDSRTFGKWEDKEACGWSRLEDINVSENLVVRLLFKPGANNPVHPNFKRWFTNVVINAASKLPLRTLTVSSTTEGIHARTSWHYKGGAVDISAINGSSITSLGDSLPVKTLQEAAISLGARECKGPSYGTDSYHRNHIHISLVVPTSQLCEQASSKKSYPQNVTLDSDA